MGNLSSMAGALPLWVRRFACAGALLLASCGGGGNPAGGGGSGSQAGVGSGGTGSYSNGPITAFGSIVVNDVHYDHTSADSIEKDDDDGETNGNEHAPTDLKLGMTVEVDVDVMPPSQGGGLKIRFGSDLLGPVNALPTTVSDSKAAVGVAPDLHPKMLRVMGHDVLVDDKTFVGEELEKLSDLQVNDIVEIYGYEDLKYHVYRATRIELKEAYTGPYVVRGVIENLSGDAASFNCDVAGQHITYAVNAAGSAVANGQVARFELMRSPSADGWLAMRMNVNAPLAASDRSEATVTGLVTMVDATSQRFTLNGVAVDVSLMRIALPMLGDALTVKGSLVNGVVMATDVVAKSP